MTTRRRSVENTDARGFLAPASFPIPAISTPGIPTPSILRAEFLRNKQIIVRDGPFAGLLRGHYQLILADPPWRFATRSAKGLKRAPQSHYDCMPLDQIKQLPVPELAAKNCALLLWGIDPMLPQALEVMDAWGFRFSTVAFTWAKLNKRAPSDRFTEKDLFTGLGYWTRANAEFCLLGVRGRPKRISRDVRRLIVAPRREHSRKPDESYVRAERLIAGPRLELFARQWRPGWDCWGNETTLFSETGERLQAA